MSTVHIKNLPRELAVSFAARTNLLLVSKPAVGKSQTIGVAVENMRERIEGFGLWKFDMTTANPNDLMAYMPNPETHKLEGYPNNTLPNAYDDPNLVGFVEIDEVLNGDPSTTKVFQKYINGESVGGLLRKPDNVICVMASNRIADKAGVMQQSRAFMRRTEQLEVFSDAAHNLKFADRSGFYPALLKFFEKFPDLIDNYETVFEVDRDRKDSRSKDEKLDHTEEGKRGIWANMASWERVSKLEFAARALKFELNPSRILGNVGKAAGTQYVTYRAMFEKIASVEEIVANPKGVAIPTKMDEMFVMVRMLAQLVHASDMKPAGIFVDRLPGDMRALAIRNMVQRSQKNRAAFDIGGTKEYHTWMQDPAISDLFMAAR